MEKQLLVKRAVSYYHNPEFGLLQPIAIMHENGVCQSIIDVQEEFPNGKIWVSKGFRDLETTIGNDELFILERYEVSGEDWQDNPSRHKYYAFGHSAKKLNAHEFIQIIEHDSLPDKATGRLSVEIDTPKNKYFFILIKEENAVYGPFKSVDNQQEKTKVLAIPSLTPLNLPQDNIVKYDYGMLKNNDVLITLNIDNEERCFIRETHTLKTLKYDAIDYISDKTLIKYFLEQKFLKKGNVSIGKTAVKNLQSIIEQHGNTKIKFFENTDRFERIKKLLGDFLDQADYGQEIVDDFLFNTNDGRLFLNDYFEKHKDRLVQDKRSELQKEIDDQKAKLLAELDKLEIQKKLKKDELIKLQEEVKKEEELAKAKIEEIRLKTDEETHKELSKKHNELVEKKNSLEEEVKILDKEISSFYEQKKDIKTYSDLISDKIYLEKRKKELEEEKRQIEEAVETKKNLLTSSKLNEDLIKYDTIKSILANKVTYQENMTDSYAIKAKTFNLSDNKKAFIDDLNSTFNKDSGRSFTYDETANLIICLSQSFLTILSGPPGTGKTSTAIRLAKYLGLVDGTNKTSRNFLNIAVGRGWTSSRDILGFYNSLKDVYQPSKAGLYQFLRKHPNKDIQDDKFLKLVLMDEANLSSIEHYWSDFLIMCDKDIANQLIDLGSPDEKNRYLTIPESLRFIATINNDDTTEKLSPRLIDRAPVISLSYEHDDLGEYYDDQIELKMEEGAINYHDIQRCFDVPFHEAKLEDEDISSFNKILESLKDSRFNSKAIEISHRKRNAIFKYCHVANQLEFTNKPMDFAISQHILPLINGNGSAFRERLENLQAIFEKYNYVRSRKILDEIMKSSEYDFYSFF